MKKRAQAGFTLIELMIAMLILAFISVGIYNATNETFKRRTEAELDGDFYNSLRMVFDVIGRDVTAIYTPQSQALPPGFGMGPSGASGASAQQQYATANTQDFGPPLPFWGAPVNDKGVRPSRFQGEESKIMFVANSHMRLYRDTPESELVNITYLLESPKNPEPGAKGKVLVKHENTAVFEDDERAASDFDQSYPLIDTVKSITFEYLDGEKDQWSKKWDSEGMDHKGKFPDVIKVTLEVYTPYGNDNTFTVVQQYGPELHPL